MSKVDTHTPTEMAREMMARYGAEGAWKLANHREEVAATERTARFYQRVAGAIADLAHARSREQAARPEHVCEDHAVPYSSDGPLGHGWECGVCGNFLQAG